MQGTDTDRTADLEAAARSFTERVQSGEPFTRTAFDEAPLDLNGYAVAGVVPTYWIIGSNDYWTESNIFAFIEQVDRLNSVPGIPTVYVGGWHDPETGCFHLDATIIVEDLDTARILGKAWNQLAIGEFRNNEYMGDIAL